MSILTYPQTFRKSSVNIPVADYQFSTNPFILEQCSWDCTAKSLSVTGPHLLLQGRRSVKIESCGMSSDNYHRFF